MTFDVANLGPMVEGIPRVSAEDPGTIRKAQLNCTRIVMSQGGTKDDVKDILAMLGLFRRV